MRRGQSEEIYGARGRKQEVDEGGSAWCAVRDGVKWECAGLGRCRVRGLSVGSHLEMCRVAYYVWRVVYMVRAATECGVGWGTPPFVSQYSRALQEEKNALWAGVRVARSPHAYPCDHVVCSDKVPPAFAFLPRGGVPRGDAIGHLRRRMVARYVPHFHLDGLFPLAAQLDVRHLHGGCTRGAPVRMGGKWGSPCPARSGKSCTTTAI